MGVDRCIAEAALPSVCGNKFSFDIYLDYRCREDDLGFVSYQCIRHRVIVLVTAQIDMSVLLHCHFCIAPHLIWRIWQGTEFLLLNGVEVFFSCIRPLLHTGLIMAGKKL